MSVDKLNDRLESYLNRLKDDIEKMAERNLKLFNRFTEVTK